MSDATIDEIIDAYLEDDDRSDVSTGIVGNHISQMILYGVRKGVEFYLQEDESGERNKILQRLITDSKIELYLNSIWAYTLGRGSVLLYLRPTKDFYELLWFPKEQFKVFYGKDGKIIDKVIITYPFEVQEEYGQIQTRKWVRLTVSQDEIRQGIYDHNPSLLYLSQTANEEVVENTLGVVPCVVIDNNPKMRGQRGNHDFVRHASLIERHNRLAGAIYDNLEFFGNPTLVTTRPAKQVTEHLLAGSSSSSYRGAATSSGFENPAAGMYSSQRTNMWRSPNNDGRVRIKKVIGSVQPDERIGYVVPDAVSGDQNQVESALAEKIRASLGGVAELGFQAGATATELKTLYGRAAATASMKARAIYTYGLCEIFELAIAFEEHLFMKSFTQVVGWDVAANGELSQQQVRAFVLGDEDQEIEGQGIPPNVIGILPQASGIKVAWRWKGPVYEDTPQDQNMKSIVMRNFTEEGVSTIEALKTVHPDRTDAEINAMLGGVPFRRGTKILGMAQQVAGLYGQLMSLPSINNPGAPLGLLMGDRFEQTIGLLMGKLIEEMNRGGNNNELANATDIIRQFAAGADLGELAAAQQSGAELGTEPTGNAERSNELPATVPDPWLLSNTGIGSYAAPAGAGWTDTASAPTASGAGQRDWISAAAQRSTDPYGARSINPAGAAGIIPGVPFNGPADAELLPGASTGPAGLRSQRTSPSAGSTGSAGISSATNGAAVQPAGYSGSRQQSLRPDFISPIPTPGSTVSRDAYAPGLQQFGSQFGNTSNVGPAGNADLRQQPGLWAKLFPTAATILERIAKR